ncbi:hypothetical protein [Yinghuangia sp. YIM S09857]|uniref:hypothetical protein n=1 Tax=Yinghuangia sp. YIM S09857 TaxID=3436929 RepID=UPI003F53D0B9
MDIYAVTNRPPATAPSPAATPRSTEAPSHHDARRRRGRRRRLVPVAAFTLSMAAFLTACGDDDDPATDQPSAQGIATATPGEQSPPQITPPDAKQPTQSSSGAGSTAHTTKPSGGGGAVVEFELPAEIGGVPRLPQAGNPTVTRLVGRSNAGYAKDLARVQTAVYGPSPTDQSQMVLLVVATRGPETTPAEYVGQSGPPGMSEVKVAVADKGVQRCWADTGRMICEWGDDNMFVSFWSAAGPSEHKAVEEQFIALRKQLTV